MRGALEHGIARRQLPQATWIARSSISTKAANTVQKTIERGRSIVTMRSRETMLT